MRKVALAVIPLLASLLVATGFYVVSNGSSKVELTAGAQRAYDLLAGKCQRGNEAACEQLKITEVARGLEFDQAIAMIEQQMVGDAFFEAECHQVAHIIGRIAYTQMGIAKVVDTMPGICRAGLIHGAQEEWADDKELDILTEEARTLCNSLEELGGAALDTCTHGIGHTFEHELQDWVGAGKLCEQTLEGWKAAACLSGAVMSFVDIETENGRLRDNASLLQLFNRCDEFSEQGVVECSRAAGLAMMRGKVNDIPVSSQLCALGERPDMVSNCVLGVGMETGYLNATNPPKAIEDCMVLANDAQDPCLAGAALWIATNQMDTAAATAICDGRPAGRRQYCDTIMEQVQRQSDSMSRLEQR
jgi:hypothetical protein